MFHDEITATDLFELNAFNWFSKKWEEKSKKLEKREMKTKSSHS